MKKTVAVPHARTVSFRGILRRSLICGGGITLRLLIYSLLLTVAAIGANAQNSAPVCMANGAPASAQNLRPDGWDLVMSLGTCDARVQTLTIEWHELNSDGTLTACHLHHDGDGDAGDADDEREERNEAGDVDGRHHCGIIHVNPATGLALLLKLKYNKTYSFTATAHTVQPSAGLAAAPLPANLVLANFTVMLPGNAPASALVFVNRLRLALLAPTGTCACTGPLGNICPPEAKFLSLQSTLPPATMSPGQPFSAHLTFANCYDTTDFPVGDRIWMNTGGYFLKARPTFATDLTTWGLGSLPLPSNTPCYVGPCAIVNPGEMVSFDFPIHAR